MSAAQKMTPEAELELANIIDKSLEKRFGKQTAPKIEAPRMHDQEVFDAFDPLKGKGIGLVRFLKARQAAREHGCSLIEAAKRLGDERTAFLLSPEGSALSLPLAKGLGMNVKALGEQVGVDGGFLVPAEYAAEFLPLLRNDTVILESGARVMPMSALELVVGRQNSAGTASYVGENAAVTASQQGFGQLILALKKLMALTPAGNDFLRDGGPAAEQKVRDDLLAVMRLQFDSTGLRGSGGQFAPKGIKSLVNGANTFSAAMAGSASTFQEIAGDLAKAKRLIRAANVPMQGLGWVISPRSEQYLMSVASTYGVFPFKEEMSRGLLWGIPYRVTAAIPENLGGSSNASEVYLVAWPQFLVGQGLGLQVELFPNGVAPDSSGTMTSGISNDMSWVRAIHRHDFALAYDKAAVLIDTVKWGA